MNFPLSISNDSPNNVLMTHAERYDKLVAGAQWMKVYRRIAREALVYILPGHRNLQDLPFVANIACFLPHLAGTIVTSRYSSLPRVGEEDLALSFFSKFPYKYVIQSPLRWEGEADLKWVEDNLYIGGVGERSSRAAFLWMRKRFDMEIIEIELTDPKLYHLDCVFMKLPGDRALVNVDALSWTDVRKLEHVVDIVPVPSHHKYSGWTNGIMLGATLLHSAISTADDFAEALPELKLECFDLTEFEKSGADLSCLVMHLNHWGRL